MKIVAYYRVSTRKQGDSGLGLEGQEAAVLDYAERNKATTLASYTEIESGKRADRPKLAAALAHAKRSKAVLVVAKLDRLARNVAFLSTVMESGAEFIAVDNPHANKLTIHILAAVAEDEARRISERTKAALMAYKARGGVLGGKRTECRNLTDAARRKGAKAAVVARQRNAKEAYADLLPTLVEMKGEGLTLREMAVRLNAEGQSTRRGKPWNHVQIKRVMDQQ